MGNAVAAALALLLFCGAVAAAWNQTLDIWAKDKNGLPAAYCDIKITYQMANQNLTSDGVATGTTNSEGGFSAHLTNTVPDGNDSKRIRVQISTYYWEGESRLLEASPEPGMRADFTVPFELEKLQVTALSSSGARLAGASVEILGTQVKGTADGSGVAVFYLPKGLRFSGSVKYGAESQQFASSQLQDFDGGKAIEVRMLPPKPPANQTPPKILFGFTVSDYTGKPAAGQEVGVSYQKVKASATTDERGFAQIELPSPATVGLSIKRNDYLYPFTFQVSSSRNESLVLPALLRVGTLSQIPQGRNCYRLSANVSDPRPSLPLKVALSKTARNITTQADTEVDESGLFFASLCVTADTQVKMVASNKYETAESPGMQLAFQANLPQAQASAPKPEEKPNYEPVRTPVDYTLWAVVAAIVMILGAGAYLARKQLGQPFKFVVEYVRLIYAALTNKRKPKPKKPVTPESQPPA